MTRNGYYFKWFCKRHPRLGAFSGFRYWVNYWYEWGFKLDLWLCVNASCVAPHWREFWQSYSLWRQNFYVEVEFCSIAILSFFYPTLDLTYKYLLPFEFSDLCSCEVLQSSFNPFFPLSSTVDLLILPLSSDCCHYPLSVSFYLQLWCFCFISSLLASIQITHKLFPFFLFISMSFFVSLLCLSLFFPT